MFRVAVAGGLLGGIYGLFHNQVTYSLSSEYFTQLKFDQFRYADAGLGNRVFAGTIGFLATWWAGLIAGWFLARRAIPGRPGDQARRPISRGMLMVLSGAVLGGLFGYGYGLQRSPGAVYPAWHGLIVRLNVTDAWSFIRVAYIHNGSYLGGLAGLVAALVMIRPATVGPDQRNDLASP